MLQSPTDRAHDGWLYPVSIPDRSQVPKVSRYVGWLKHYPRPFVPHCPLSFGLPIAPPPFSSFSRMPWTVIGARGPESACQSAFRPSRIVPSPTTAYSFSPYRSSPITFPLSSLHQPMSVPNSRTYPMFHSGLPIHTPFFPRSLDPRIIPLFIFLHPHNHLGQPRPLVPRPVRKLCSPRRLCPPARCDGINKTLACFPLTRFISPNSA